MKKNSVLIIIVLLWIQSAALAEELEIRMPNGCQTIGYSFKHYALLLHPHDIGKKQSLYFIFNSAPHAIKLYQMRHGDETFTMHLNNTIGAYRWGVFATDEKEEKFICTKASKKNEYGKIKDCEKTLKICEFKNVEFSSNNHGNYWAVKSNSRRGSINTVIYQGVFLKW